MNKPRIYIETSVIGFWVGFATGDPKMQAWQAATRRFVEEHNDQLLISDLVLDECGKGDPRAAQYRTEFTDRFPMLLATPEARDLASRFISPQGLPTKAGNDALHVAIAATCAVSFLATWNCTHLANPHIRKRVENICLENGYVAPEISTPDELLGKLR